MTSKTAKMQREVYGGKSFEIVCPELQYYSFKKKKKQDIFAYCRSNLRFQTVGKIETNYYLKKNLGLFIEMHSCILQVQTFVSVLISYSQIVAAFGVLEFHARNYRKLNDVVHRILNS